MRTHYWADAALLGVAFIWGVNIPVMKNGLEQVDHYVFNAIRLVISSIVLGLLALNERRRAGATAAAATQRGVSLTQLLIYSVVVAGAYQLLFLIGVARTTSGNTALIFSTVPLWTALFGRVFLGERLRWLAWIGLMIALAGTIVVALQKGDVTADAAHGFGNLVVLVAALTWAGGTVYSRPLLQSVSPLELSAKAAIIALPIHLLFAAGTFADSLPAFSSPNLWLIVLYSGVLSTGLALPMWNFGVRHAGAAHAAVVQNVIPVIAIVAAWLFRGEVMSLGQIVGGTLILGGLVTMRLARPNPTLPLANK